MLPLTTRRCHVLSSAPPQVYKAYLGPGPKLRPMKVPSRSVEGPSDGIRFSFRLQQQTFILTLGFISHFGGCLPGNFVLGGPIAAQRAAFRGARS